VEEGTEGMDNDEGAVEVLGCGRKAGVLEVRGCGGVNRGGKADVLEVRDCGGVHRGGNADVFEMRDCGGVNRGGKDDVFEVRGGCVGKTVVLGSAAARCGKAAGGSWRRGARGWAGVEELKEDFILRVAGAG